MNISRRNTLLASSAAATWSLIPGKVLGANEKVNLAVIGLGQQGGNIAGTFARDPNVNIVALCDVDIDSDSPIATKEQYGDQGWMNETATPAHNAAKYPQARQFRDFREMFDKMEKKIDAVCIGVPDHSHFPISMAAMNFGT